MSLAKLQGFIQYLRASNIMAQEDILRAIRQMSAFDRRLGHLGAFRGYIQPEQINTILWEQARSGSRFGECAVRLKLMTEQQVVLLLRLQKDDLFLFAQAAVTQKLTTIDKVVAQIKAYLNVNPEMAKEAEAPPSEDRIQLDRQSRSVMRSIEEVSPLPATAHRAVSMLDDPDVHLDAVGETLTMDPGLTTTLLRVVNSAFYGLRDKVTSVSKAVIVLGIKKLRQLVIAAAVMQKFQAIPPQFAQKFWETSVRAAQWSKELAAIRNMAEADELFICGLLHNIGYLVTIQYFRTQQLQIEQLVQAGKRPLDAERAVMGGTHADVGGFLFNLWQMPKETIQCTMFHHHDLQLIQTMPNLHEAVLVIHMAGQICELDPNLDALGYSENLERIAKRYRPLLKLPESLNMDSLAEKVDSNFGQLLENLGG